ncbi:hypothetical protein BU24DRAFT_449818 [Aaosphaeria arxii CBS 175.79]|uniref:F-box domain-containing protein n=1 Tax=Aaosphaeria arxii CBS 175.79 TaxID=1450172 RepID=A0A6A5XZF5_9PLEO|nr:uncharacterized protein BU24DRAFT_449818 [Aaosphaeria arxii CBS 175.79]KAF2018359.1 hypothetical protein BU24DRAFT_449818 [Aaosphaeria arxii CBS 175.79]
MNNNFELPPLLRLPPELRREIYSYLNLAPSPEEEITTINYALDWPFFEHPSSTTFTAHQVDRCRCPQQSSRRTNTRTEDHIYTRYVCHGPEVQFATRSRSLWVLEKPGPAFNILRPASQDEKERRPDAGIISVNKTIYRETIPLLYRQRNFLFLTSICSRGRYQAYATQQWLSLHTAYARSQITSISLLCQENEEDCRLRDVAMSYVNFSKFALRHLVNFQSLCLNVWSSDIPLYPFAMLFHRPEMRIYVKTHVGDPELYGFYDEGTFMSQFGDPNGQWAESYEKHVKELGSEEHDSEESVVDEVV